jgi:adenylate cyclase
VTPWYCRPSVSHRDGRQPPRARVPAREVRAQLERVFASADFDGSKRSRELLRFIVEESLAGRADAITQPTIATRVFGRRDDFDAVVDPIVRIQAGRLRRSLERYYLLSGAPDPVRIELPKGAYAAAFRTVAANGSTAREVGPTDVALASAADEWPAVWVGAIETTPGEPELAAPAEHLRDVLALELGGYRIVRVVRQGPAEPKSRSRARFAIVGTLRRRNGTLAMSARLVDRSSGDQIWGGDHEAAADAGPESPELDDMARAVAARVGSEEGVLVRLLAGERRNRKAEEATTYDAILGAYDFFFVRDRRTVPGVVEALRGVVAAEPECGLAWTLLGRLYLANSLLEAAPIPTPIEQATSYAQTGVRLDPTSRVARAALAATLLFSGEIAAAREELDRALALNPGSFVYLEMIGWLLTLCGDGDRGPSVVRRAVDRNPSCLPHAAHALWVAGLQSGDFEGAYRAALDYRDPTFFWRALMRASCLGLLGRAREARAAVGELLEQQPDFRTRGVELIGRFIRSPEVMKRIVAGLATAGLRLR